MSRRKRMHISIMRTLLVAALGGMIAGAAELAAALPEYAHWIAFGALILAPVANQLQAAVQIKESGIELPEKRNAA